jgi:hypothetical protein
MTNKKTACSLIATIFCLGCMGKHNTQSLAKGNCVSRSNNLRYNNDNFFKTYKTQLRKFSKHNKDPENIEEILIKKITTDSGERSVLRSRIEFMHNRLKQILPKVVNGKSAIAEGYDVKISTDVLEKPGLKPQESSLIFYPTFISRRGKYRLDIASPIEIRQYQTNGNIASQSSNLQESLNQAFITVKQLSRSGDAPENLYEEVGNLFWLLVHTQPFKENSEALFFKVLENTTGKSITPVLALFRNTYSISLEHLAMTMSKTSFAKNFEKLAGQRIPQKNLISLGIL